MANTALRVLALAERPLRQWPLAAHDAANPEAIEQGLTLLGLIGLQDPPRLEVFDAVQRCKRAGMCTVMITGDHPDTARAIARELGILTPDDAVVIGSDLDGMSEQELAQRVPSLSVYARVTAEHKLRIVRAWKARGAVVALSAFAYAWYSEHNLTHARDAAFSVLVVAELLRAFGARSETRTVWQMGLLSHRPLCVIVIASLALQLALHHLPALQALFGTRLSRCASMRHGSCSGLSPSSPWKCARSSAGPRLGMPTRCQVQ